MKKVLVITYYWPPSGGPGVQRILKFCKYLPHLGWEPIVLTVQNGEYPNIDQSLKTEVESLKIKVFKTKTIEPFRIFKFFTKKKSLPTFELSKNKKSIFSNIAYWIRMNLFIPDARIGWIPFAVKSAKKIILDNKVDLVFSSGPPHSIHFIGRKLKKDLSIPWLADFRDPWIDLFYYSNHKRLKISKKLDKIMEREILKKADSIVTATNGLRILLKKKIKKNISVVYNGFDNDDFIGIEKNNNQNEKIIISYVGTIARSQIPHNFLQSVKEINKSGANAFIHFVGDVDPSLFKVIDDYSLGKNVEIIGYLPHNESIKKMLNSSYLLLIIPKAPENKLIVTGKLFEYIRTGVPIIGIGPSDGEASKILEQTKTGKMFDYSESSNIINFMKDRKKSNGFNINYYSRKSQTEILVEQFRKCVND